MVNGAIVRREDLADLKDLGTMLIESRMFKDVSQVAQAVVKVQAGRELGLGPVESMRAFHVIEGKVEASADLLATLVKRHPSYDYRVRALTDDACRIEFFQDGESIGISEFTEQDRENAGLRLVDSKGQPTPWTKFPRNMFFARAMSNGVAWFCPDVTSGARIYVEGEATDTFDEEPGDGPSVVEVSEVAAGTSAARGEPPASENGAPSEPGEVVDPTPSLDTAPATSSAGAYEEAMAQAVEDKATTAQLRKLMVLASRFEWDDETRRRKAGVASFKDLTKHRASQLIELWEADEPERPVADSGGAASDEAEAGSEDGVSIDDGADMGSASPGEGLSEDLAEATEQQWSTALTHFPNRAAVLSRAVRLFPELGLRSEADITKRILAEVIMSQLAGAKS